jgi:hypothetical protein
MAMESTFRINLYTEREEQGRLGRRQAWQTAALSGLFGLNMMLVASLFVSATLLQERQQVLAADSPQLVAEASTKNPPDPEMDLARELFRVRQGRTDWAPKLATLSEVIDSTLVLEQIRAEGRRKKVPARLELDGVTRGQNSNLEDVTRFISALRGDQRIREDFSRVSLGTIKSGVGEFQIICEPAAK